MATRGHGVPTLPDGQAGDLDLIGVDRETLGHVEVSLYSDLPEATIHPVQNVGVDAIARAVVRHLDGHRVRVHDARLAGAFATIHQTWWLMVPEQGEQA